MKHLFHLSGWKRFRIDLGNEKRNAGDEERLHNDISGRKQKSVKMTDRCAIAERMAVQRGDR